MIAIETETDRFQDRNVVWIASSYNVARQSANFVDATCMHFDYGFISLNLYLTRIPLSSNVEFCNNFKWIVSAKFLVNYFHFFVTSNDCNITTRLTVGSRLCLVPYQINLLQQPGPIYTFPFHFKSYSQVSSKVFSFILRAASPPLRLMLSALPDIAESTV